MPSSLLALLDDIAAVLDDVAVMTKLATKKTAGVLGDDLALNAEQVVGVAPERELPVVWAVMRGSALNKLILVPAALLLSELTPWLVTPLLMIGGVFLCYEGVEKLAHKLLHREQVERDQRERVEALGSGEVDMLEFEKAKIRGAIRTDFVLSAEIVVISLGTISDATLAIKAGVLTLIAIVATLGIYGLVAGIVKIDDLGVALRRRGGAWARAVGSALLRGAPLLMRLLSVVGTIAMFLVGGGIIVHGVKLFKGWSRWIEERAGEIEGAGTLLDAIAPTLFDGVVGVVSGTVALGVVGGCRRLFVREAAEPV